MKDKEMIEEMAKDIEQVEKEVYSVIVKETRAYVQEHHKYNSKEDYSLAHIKTVHERTAEDMFNLGYRKLPKDSVVLSKEEINNAEYFYVQDGALIPVEKGRGKFITNEWYKELLMKMPLAHELAKERKETAEKYRKLTEEAINKVPHAPELFKQAWREKNNELAKQFGVEIKE